MVRKVLKISLCALLLSSVNVLGACGDDDSSDGTEDDGDDGTEADAGDDDGGEPDAGADSGLDEVVQEGPFFTLPEGVEPIEGSMGRLVRTPEGVEIELTVPGQTPGNIYSMWWVIIQNPEACQPPDPEAEIRCNPNDTAGGPEADPERYTATQGALVYGIPRPSGAVIADEDGTVTFTRSYAANTDPTDGIYVKEGEDKSYWEGLTDVMAAEIHVAIRDKGPPSDDPEILRQQNEEFLSANCAPPDDPKAGDSCGTRAALPTPPVVE